MIKYLTFQLFLKIITSLIETDIAHRRLYDRVGIDRVDQQSHDLRRVVATNGVNNEYTCSLVNTPSDHGHLPPEIR